MSYFVTLAASICRRLEAFNSDAYSKCLIAASLNPQVSIEEKRQLIDEYNSKATLYPYYDQDRIYYINKDPGSQCGMKGVTKAQVLSKAKQMERLVGCLLTLRGDFTFNNNLDFAGVSRIVY